MKVSIVTPNYNRADLLIETATSIFNQTNPNWEWVIVDDGSTDESLQVMQEFAAKDSRVKVYSRDRLPKGAAACRNIAIEKSSGDYLIFLDSDDLLASLCVEQRLSAAKENPEYDFLIFPLLMFKEKPDDTCLLWNIDNGTDDFTRVLLGDPICQGTGTIWKKQSFINIGKWDENLLLWQDVELHLRTFLQDINYKKLLHLPPDIFIRLSEVSLSRTGFNSLPKFKSRMKVFKDTVGLANQLNLIEKYKGALAKMGFDLISSAIHNNYFSEANELLKMTSSNNFLDSSSSGQLRKYYLAKRLKLHKFPIVNRYAAQPINTFFAHYQKTLNKIVYGETVKL